VTDAQVRVNGIETLFHFVIEWREATFNIVSRPRLEPRVSWDLENAIL
jgi:hypothetical protein